ncbi:MAG: gliding motility-associated ABC transporter substrate-binding protein GldG [Flavobacteriales bacterium]
MKALFLKEIRGFINSLTGFITVTIFLLATGVFMWIFPGPENVFDNGEASLDSLFFNAPMVFLFLIPAITMRMFAEEKRNGTIEMLFTKPLTDIQIILAKFLAGVALVSIALLPTFVYFFTVIQLGDPIGNIDFGATWGAYIGLFFLGAVFVSIGILASITTSNQVVAFLLALLLCFVMYGGIDYISTLFGGSTETVFQKFGILEHYISIKRGVVDSRDVLYFVSLILFFLSLSLFLLKRQYGRINESESTLSNGYLRILLLFGVLLVANIIVSFKFLRIDLTEEKVHSLSSKTIELLETLKEEGNVFNIEIYLDGDLPADIHKLKLGIKEKLDEFKAYNNTGVKYTFIDPAKDKMLQDRLLQQLKAEGLQPVSVQERKENEVVVKQIWPVAIIRYGGEKQSTIQFIAPGQPLDMFSMSRIIGQLEYSFLKEFTKLTTKTTKRIAFLEGHGELNEMQTAHIEKELRQFYHTERVNIKQENEQGQLVEKLRAFEGFDALVVAKPQKEFTEKEKFIIDQFIMRGGKVAWLIDPVLVYEDSLRYSKTGETMGLSMPINIDDQLFHYGVRLNKNLLLDRRCRPIEIPGLTGKASWYFHPVVFGSDENRLTKNMDPVKLQYVSSVDPVGGEKVKKTVLLQTSDFSLMYNVPVRISYNTIRMNPNFSNQNNKPFQPVALYLEGSFESFYKNRITGEFAGSGEYKMLENSGHSQMLVVADGDLIRNELYVNKDGIQRYINIDFEPITGFKAYGNSSFFLNLMDEMLGNDYLVDLRNRFKALRPLNMQKIDKERTYWQSINIVLPILVLGLISVIQFFLRRKRFAVK